MIERYFKVWQKLLAYNDMENEPLNFTGELIFLGLALGVAATVIFQMHGPIALIPVVLSIIAVQVGAYAYLLHGSNVRAGKVEEVLPDFLSLVASNIHSGLTPDKALIISARPEFGSLTKAVNEAGKGSITGMPLDKVMMDIGERINSDTLHKTMRLLVEGLHSGGDMAELLEKTAYDLRKFRSVRRETNSMILNYVLFIVAAITFGAPLLYGIASFLVEIMLKIKTKIGTSPDSAIMGSVSVFKGQILFTSDSVTIFTAAAVIVTVFFGCMAVGVMSTGKKMDGFKYFPLLVCIALGILFGVKLALGALLGPLINA